MGRIWVVDDQPDVSRAMVALLRQAGHRGTAFLSGEAALEQLGADVPDLMILDVMMPGLDGFQLAEALRRDEETRRIPLIFLSDHDDSAAADRAYALGAVAYLSKACDFRAAASLVAGVLARFAPNDSGLVA